MRALVVINLQNDFCDDGAVAVPNSIQIIPIINRVRDYFKIVIFVQEWHPKDHVSFYCAGGNQPPHCIAGTKGAELNGGLDLNDRDFIIHKGTLVLYDSNSAFYDATTINKTTNLLPILKHHRIKELYLCGVTLEGDILSTAIDAQKFHYETKIIEDATMGIHPIQMKTAREYLVNVGVEFVNSKQIEKLENYQQSSSSSDDSHAELALDIADCDQF